MEPTFANLDALVWVELCYPLIIFKQLVISLTFSSYYIIFLTRVFFFGKISPTQSPKKRAYYLWKGFFGGKMAQSHHVLRGKKS
jgi:hypothetical protein